MFRPDAFGSTFLFVDMDYAVGVIKELKILSL